MGDIDLMEFCSPQSYMNSQSPEKNSPSKSPGNNPFDVFSRLAETFNSDSFREPSNNFFDKSFSNVDSWFSNGRESFGIGSMDECGRESLGILKMDIMDMDDIISSNMMSTRLFPNSFNTSKSAGTSLLNTAFLQPPSFSDYRSIYLSSCSIISPNPLDFHSGSLECSEPSKIYSINSSRFSQNLDLLSKTEDILNDAFINSLKSLNENGYDTRSRLFSMPELNSLKIRTGSLLSKSENCVDINNSLPIELDDNASEINMDEAFNDSVFIEANHLASKIADGSILSIECFEDNLLDCTSPPEFEDEICEPTEINTENVFRCIDKMVPVSENLNIATLATDNLAFEYPSAPVLNTDSIVNDVHVEEQSSSSLKQNLSNVFSRKSGSSNSSASKDPNELLNNLSEIINNGNRDLQQNLEGQKLLFGLADILCSNVSTQRAIDSLDDSGHSSIEHEEQQNENDYKCYEVLDLRVASKSAGNEQVLDLSVKSKQFSHSFSVPSSKKIATPMISNIKSRTSSASSTSSMDQSKVNSFGAVKLKPKRVEDNIVQKKGPLKAVIPVGSMSKQQNSGEKSSPVTVTPPRVEHVQSLLFKVKRSSTPIMEPKLKPMAQSTPDGPNFELDKSRSFNSPRVLSKPKSYNHVSPLVCKKNIIVEKLSGSTQLNHSSPLGSAANLLKKRSSLPSSTLTRRHSESELKANKPTNTLKRSYSIGKGSKITTNTTEKPKQSILSTKNIIMKNPAVLQEKNRSISNMKPYNLLNKMKRNKSDKENITT